MIAQFVDRQGRPFEIAMQTADLPSIGDEIKVKGRWYKRVASLPTIAGKGLDYRVRDKGVHGRGLPRKHSMDPSLHGLVDGWNDKGEPMFESDHAARRWVNAANSVLDRAGSNEPRYEYEKEQPDGETIAEMQQSAREAMYASAAANTGFIDLMEGI